MIDSNEIPSASLGTIQSPSLETLSAGQLPSTALPKSIDYTYLGLNTPYAQSPIVYLPFSTVPSEEEVQAVGEHFARFVAEQTGEPARYVSKISRSVRSLAAEEKKRRAHSYRVTLDSSTTFHSPEIKAVINICGEEYSGVDTALTLEAYVQKVKSER